MIWKRRRAPDPTVRELVDLTERFVAGDLPAPEFDSRFRLVFATLPAKVDVPTFRALEELQFACNFYVEDPDLRDSPEDVDEEQLHNAALAALTTLRPLARRDTP